MFNQSLNMKNWLQNHFTLSFTFLYILCIRLHKCKYELLKIFRFLLYFRANYFFLNRNHNKILSKADFKIDNEIKNCGLPYYFYLLSKMFVNIYLEKNIYPISYAVLSVKYI